MPKGRYPWSMGARAGGPLLGGETAFISNWVTSNSGTSANDQITLPLVAVGNYDFTVNWGDGSPDDTIIAFNDPAVTHTFIGGPGTFEVTIKGDVEGWQFNNGGDAQKLIEVVNWGDLKIGANTLGQFNGCSNMIITASDSLDTATVDNMSSMFLNCSSLTELNLNGSSTSLVTAMDSMFQNCSNLLTLNVSGFDTSLVTNMIQMFRNCSNLTSIDVSGFDTSLVTFMISMFHDCNSLALVDVSGFDTSSVSLMNNMFASCSGVSVLDVSGFDTSLVTNMSSMFVNCSGISALALDQAGWDIGLVTDLTSFCLGVTLTTGNYDSILAAWAAQSPVQSGVTCSFGNSVYTIATAQADRDTLTNAPNSWTLTDGGGI